MTQRSPGARGWRVGELANAAGMTVRALHHYEQLGLLVPAKRTPGRQRHFDQRDLGRLYTIRALRDLGLSLAEVGRVLKRDGIALSDVLRAHRQEVDLEIQRLRKLRTLLDHACTCADDRIDPDALFATIQAMSQIARRAEERNHQHREQHGSEARWRALGAELRACMEARASPASPRVRTIAREAFERIHAFGKGDRATLDALAHLREFAPPTELAGWDPPLFRYLQRALHQLRDQQGATTRPASRKKPEHR